MDRRLLILDSHCDTPSQIYRGRDIRLDSKYSQVDIPKMLKGGVSAMFFAAYCPASLPISAATNYAMQLIEQTKAAVADNPDSLALAFSEADLLQNFDKGLISIFLALENAQPIGKDLNLLRQFYRLGVRYMTLCHSADNEVCDSCASHSHRWGGLSPFGVELVREMNRLGMLIDVSHISDAAFYDVLKVSEKPVVATHSCCRALADHPRNMTDDMICRLAQAGGVIQINFYPVFLDDDFARVYKEGNWGQISDDAEEPFIADPTKAENISRWHACLDLMNNSLRRPSYKRIVDHIDHVVNLVGIDYVGIGSDFDGIAVAPDGMEDVSCISKIFEEMKNRGYSDAEISKLASGNFLRVLAAQN